MKINGERQSATEIVISRYLPLPLRPNVRRKIYRLRISIRRGGWGKNRTRKSTSSQILNVRNWNGINKLSINYISNWKLDKFVKSIHWLKSRYLLFWISIVFFFFFLYVCLKVTDRHKNEKRENEFIIAACVTWNEWNSTLIVIMLKTYLATF